MEENKVTVNRRALIARINRALAKDSQTLRISRSNSEKSNFGDMYILDAGTNSVIAYHCDLNSLSKELGTLKPFEVLADE